MSLTALQGFILHEVWTKGIQVYLLVVKLLVNKRLLLEALVLSFRGKLKSIVMPSVLLLRGVGLRILFLA